MLKQRLIGVVLLLALVAPSFAQATLQSQYTLSQDVNFQQRVRQALVSSAIAISNESVGTFAHNQRVALATKVLADPARWTLAIVEGVASDAAVSAAAGSPTPNQANVTDAQINTAVTSQWNAYAGQ